MKTDTAKLYSKMKPKELAAIYCRTPDENERHKIASSVPKYFYEAIDAEFVDELDAMSRISLWWQAEFWKAKASMLGEVAIAGNDFRLANLYVSAMMGLEEALVKYGLEHVLEQNDMGLDASGLVKVYGLELVPDFVSRSKADAISVIDMALSHEKEITH